MRHIEYDMIGNRFGRLIVAQELPRHITANGNKVRRFLCRCDCGGSTETTLSNLRCAGTKSCGCLQKERTSKARTTHGATASRGYTPEYSSWKGLIGRCTNLRNAKFKDYGGRGIRVCDRWRTGDGQRGGFECFFADMGAKPTPHHSIDRIDNDGNYEPGNCRWATATQQVNNRRRKDARQPSALTN